MRSPVREFVLTATPMSPVSAFVFDRAQPFDPDELAVIVQGDSDPFAGRRPRIPMQPVDRIPEKRGSKESTRLYDRARDLPRFIDQR